MNFRNGQNTVQPQAALRFSQREARDAVRCMSKVFQDAAIPILIVDLEGRITDMNDAVVESTGWCREELLGEPNETILSPERHVSFGERLAHCLQEGRLHNVEGVRCTKSGKRHPVLLTYSLLTDESENPDGIAVIARDISELKQVHQELQQLAHRLISSQEEANRKVARELHDSFGQKLATLALEVAVLGQQLASSPSSATERLSWIGAVSRIGAEISQLGRELHLISRSLHPSILHDMGLPAALRAECDAFFRQQGIPVEFEQDNVSEMLPEEVSLCLYRVAREALQNVTKHAAAEKVRIALAGTEEGIVLRLEDSGQGFDPEHVRRKGTLGLVSMRERVRLVNGDFSVRSQPGKGTQVEVRIPLRSVRQCSTDNGKRAAFKSAAAGR